MRRAWKWKPTEHNYITVIHPWLSVCSAVLQDRLLSHLLKKLHKGRAIAVSTGTLCCTSYAMPTEPVSQRHTTRGRFFVYATIRMMIAFLSAHSSMVWHLCRWTNVIQPYVNGAKQAYAAGNVPLSTSEPEPSLSHAACCTPPWNTDNILPDYTASQPRRHYFWKAWRRSGPNVAPYCEETALVLSGLIRAFWKAWQCLRFLLSDKSHSACRPYVHKHVGRSI
jgi:hypothetical protein